MIDLRLGDCLDILPTLPSDSIDTIITDPPYGLEFMGKDWDHGVPGVPFWNAALRVAKPGAIMLAFGGTRTHHRLMCAIEDAGWEIRDCLMWLYGSGFPKSHDISKAIDKAAGAEREVVGEYASHRPNTEAHENGKYSGELHTNGKLTAPATDAAATWDGWGTALKPAWEPIILAMKPRDGTFANNALTHGVAGLWIDGGRIGYVNGDGPENLRRVDGPNSAPRTNGCYAQDEWTKTKFKRNCPQGHSQGRWPANLILDEAAAAMLGEQSGEAGQRVKGGYVQKAPVMGTNTFNSGVPYTDNRVGRAPLDAPGTAARFFYCAKASRAERTCNGTVDNKHPTVKPVALLKYLLRLTRTPTGGKVLDLFMGSGSMGVACVDEDRDFVGIEKDPGEFNTAQCRIKHARGQVRQPALEGV